jgi:3-hydroxyisobutyrate dehydrogenase-like beta-hydroxyacid dehydrogenase
MAITIALLSPGAMGAAVGRRLVDHGAAVFTSLEGRGPASIERARAAGMEDASAERLVEADILLSILPPADALGLALRLAPVLSAAANKPLYVDCNALSPVTKQAVAAVVAETGCRFVDGAILGGPPRPGHRSPAIYVAGDHSAATLPLLDLGLDIRQMDGAIGAAAALKMAFAGINKGGIGLGAAMILAASRTGAADALRDALTEVPGRLPGLRLQVPDMYPKAYRWVAEMREIAEFAGDEATAMIFEGLARLYERIAADVSGDGHERALMEAFLKG